MMRLPLLVRVEQLSKRKVHNVIFSPRGQFIDKGFFQSDNEFSLSIWLPKQEVSKVGDDWKIMYVETGVLPGEPKKYTVENVETGETKKVLAWDEDRLGEKIAEGEFIEED